MIAVGGGWALGRYAVVGPVSRVEKANCPKHFTGCETSQARYETLRDPARRASVMTYHLMHAAGRVAGFMSFQIEANDYGDDAAILVVVHHMFISHRHRAIGLEGILLAPCIRDVELALRQFGTPSNARPVRIHHASEVRRDRSADRVHFAIEELLFCRGWSSAARLAKLRPS